MNWELGASAKSVGSGQACTVHTSQTKLELYAIDPFDCLSKDRFTSLTLYSIDTCFYTSTTDCFRKHCGKRRNCS